MSEHKVATSVLLILLFALVDMIWHQMVAAGVSEYKNEPFLHSMDIQLSPLRWSVKAGNTPLLQRDARLKPQEQSLAKILRKLLDKGDYVKALSSIESAGLSEMSPALYLIKGQIYLALERWADSERALTNAIKRLPDFIRAHRNLAIIYIQQKKYKQAQKHLIKVIGAGVSDAQLSGSLAYINLQLNNPWSAIAGYQQAMLLDPENKQWQKGLLHCLVSSKNSQSAMALISEMLNTSPEDKSLWLQKGKLLLDSGDLVEALSSLEVAIRLGENNLQNKVVAAQLHIRHGSLARAVELILFVLKRDSSYFDAIEPVVSRLVYERQWNEVRQLLAQIKRYASKLNNAQRSKLYQHEARLPGRTQIEITRLYESSIKQDPANGDALIALAQHYYGLNQLIQAEMLYIRAATLKHYAERAYIGQAQIYIDQKNYIDAIKLLRLALAINPARDDLKQNISVMERIITS